MRRLTLALALGACFDRDGRACEVGDPAIIDTDTGSEIDSHSGAADTDAVDTNA